jgi:hypothetical protein
MNMTRHYPKAVKAIAISSLVLASAAAVAAPAGSPSCKAPKILREKAVCTVPKLTELHTGMEKALSGALKRLDAKGKKVLGEDQRKYVAALDSGFLNALMGEETGGPAEQEKALKDANGEGSAISSLEAELKARTEMLEAVETRKSFTGIWRNGHVKLTLQEVEGKPGTYKGEFKYAIYGAPKLSCVLKMELTSAGKQISATGATNDDTSDDYQNPIALSIDGNVMHLRESQGGDGSAGWSCPRVSALDEFMIAVRPAKAAAEE